MLFPGGVGASSRIAIVARYTTPEEIGGPDKGGTSANKRLSNYRL
jgi:hypothetical protein